MRSARDFVPVAAEGGAFVIGDEENDVLFGCTGAKGEEEDEGKEKDRAREHGR